MQPKPLKMTHCCFKSTNSDKSAAKNNYIQASSSVQVCYQHQPQNLLGIKPVFISLKRPTSVAVSTHRFLLHREIWQEGHMHLRGQIVNVKHHSSDLIARSGVHIYNSPTSTSELLVIFQDIMNGCRV